MTILMDSPIWLVPREDAGGLSREYVLRIPSVSKKATKWGDVLESPYKRGGPVSVKDGHVKEPCEISIALGAPP